MSVPQQPQPSPRRIFWTKGPGVILVVMAVGVPLFGSLLLLDNVNSKPSGDARVVSCELGGSESLPQATVGLTVHNTGKVAHSFAIEVEYRDSSGNRIDTDTARVRNLGPGDTARVDETTLLDAAVTSGTCVVVGVR